MKLFKTLIIATIGICTISACNQESKQEPTDSNQQIPIFYGEITYTTAFNSSDSMVLQTIGAFTPEKSEVYFAEDKFRLIEHGGASHGNILLHINKQEAWQLDTATKIAYLCEFSDFDHPSEELMEMMPDHFAPTVEKINGSDTIMRIVCQKYKVIRSGFIPTDDEAYIWATDQFKFPDSRFDFLSEINSVIVPFPLYIGFNSGAIMRMTLSNKNYAVTFEITEMNKTISDPAIFSIPEGYQKK